MGEEDIEKKEKEADTEDGAEAVDTVYVVKAADTEYCISNKYNSDFSKLFSYCVVFKSPFATVVIFLPIKNITPFSIRIVSFTSLPKI